MTQTAQDNINRYWTGRADSYDAHHVRQIGNEAIRTGWTNVWRRALPAPPARVLDVGTGTGHVSLLLAGLGYDVTGIDLADGMLTKAREKAATLANPPDLRLGDAVTPDFPPSSFDVVASRYVLWTLRTPREALANWRALLRPVRAAGFTDVTVTPLTEILDLDRRFGVADGHEVRPQFLITGRA